MGFGADVRSKNTGVKDILLKVRTEDLMKFGLIPEFIGRVPVVCALTELDEETLIQILTTPKNAIVKQFKKLFDLENVNLKFTDGSLRAVVKEALKRKTGARGLRAILEEAMLDVMYEMPSQKDLKEVIITEESIEINADPIMVFRSEEEIKKLAEKEKKAGEEVSESQEFGTGPSH